VATLAAGVREALGMLRPGLEEIYGERLEGLLLFGSQARGDSRADSDIDVAVVLKGPIKSVAEIERTSWLSQRINLETALLVSCVYVTREDLEGGREAIYRNIRREGVAL
jgi:predicted nucleotidyltransferase